MKNNEITRRWQAHPSLADVLAVTRGFQASPFGRTPDGLLDFRGLSLASTPLSVGGGWHNDGHEIDLRDADFSYGSWKGFDLRDAQVQRCTFASVEFVSDIRLFGVSLEDCLFKDCSFKNVHITNASLRNTRFEGLRGKDTLSFHVRLIEDCLFEGKMKKIDFKSSPIRNTRFSGELLECVFFGHPSIDVVDADAEIYREVAPDAVANRMDGVDFSDASLINCHIGNYCYLDKVIPPSPEQNCISRLSPDFFDTASALLRQDMPEALASKSLMWLETFYKPDVRLPHGVIGPRDLAKPLGADGAALFFNTLRRAATQAKTIV
ncbi:pentapeptide repeat-containing protein [Achromobacter sp. Marseille-Q0513]|uniref:pentapeptide repeat-containing protein n=1 Tax=Achromobacter sp. Marseille-Q0513 TaxID=2829161 RepID=UPI001B8EE8B6|nr:pentapeptide repeat-containing protein [Achromobacter sp. Marseille-Q0513]MBR8653484.1 pentapeptide repeat-containing protein [Achromobacter sp. Marseille-Q0513]